MMAAHFPRRIVTAAIFNAAVSVWAAGPDHRLTDVQLAGEIIVVPQTDSSGIPNASGQIDRARSYRKDEVPGATTIIIIPEDSEQGVLTPGNGGALNGARINRLKARKYQRDGTLSTEPGVVVIEFPEDDATAQGRATENRARANSYAKGDLKSVLTGKVGADGIPLVVCKGVNNQAGRIGDDIESGSVFSIVQNGRSVKVRCQ